MSRLRLFPRQAAVLVALAATLAPTSLPAEPPEAPPFYAVTNVTAVTAPGRTLENATVLLAKGLIEAVGTELEIPGDALVIDGEGLFLYPGLIDGMTALGIAKPDAESGGGGGGFGGFGGGGELDPGGPEARPATTPWFAAADNLAEDPGSEKWREAGFTAVVSTPEEGIFAGQAAVLSLGRGEADELVVATPVAQRISFASPGGFRTYPGSLMGTLAYVKQVLLDTKHYAEAKAVYAASPAGRERIAYDRALEPIQMALEAGTPFLMPGVRGKEIDRALAVAREFGLPAVIYGAHGGYERVGELAGAAGVIVDLDWPEAEKDRDPEADTSFAELYHRRMAVTTPRELAAAGIPFGFTSSGLASAGDVFKGVRRAIGAGLSEDAALAALTTGPAGIFGVDDRLGTIEAGKIANLVLATAAPWAEDVEVKAVFVDGRRFAEREEEEETEPPASDVSGTWELVMTTPRGTNEFTAKLEMSEDGKVTGELTSERGESSVEDGKMSGDLLRFETTREMGGQSFTASFSLTVEGESLSGSMSAGPMSMEISGTRTAKPEEGAKAAQKEEEAPDVTEEELAEAMALYRGPVREMGAFALTNATVWTVSGETIENGTVVVVDGKIAAVGADVAIPAGAEVIDVGGGSVIPGIIDAHSHIAIDGGVNEGSLAVTAMVSIGDVIDPDDVGIYRALAGGVTAANLLHGSANPIGGQNAVIKLRWGADAEGLQLDGAPAGIKFALGENPKRSNFRAFGMAQRYPQTRMGVMDVIRQAFREAREYRDEWRAYEAAVAARGPAPVPPRRDLKLDALVEILEGERLVHSHCYRADEILQLLRLAESEGFRVATLQHVLEGYKVADEIAEHGAGASTFSDWWGYKVEAYDAIPHNAALMTERGVLVSINSDSGEEMRHLNQEAAKAVKWGGMGEREALAMVTLNPALQLGIGDRVGSIEVGKDADLVVYDGHPLAISSVVRHTFVDGDLYFDREADRERQSGIAAIKERLMPKEEKEKDEKEEGAGEEGGEPDEPDEPDPGRTWGGKRYYSCREVG
ncbi:MAG: amidohydrolase family protein [Thermoanaerobaculia bacterium]|nr:amidohydrolase family protein [Thermoanaerobaculia bacterium]